MYSTTFPPGVTWNHLGRPGASIDSGFLDSYQAAAFHWAEVACIWEQGYRSDHAIVWTSHSYCLPLLDPMYWRNTKHSKQRWELASGEKCAVFMDLCLLESPVPMTWASTEDSGQWLKSESAISGTWVSDSGHTSSLLCCTASASQDRPHAAIWKAQVSHHEQW